MNKYVALMIIAFAFFPLTSCEILLRCCLESDSDCDGTIDSEDKCPHDPNKVEPGRCGCGEAEDSCKPESGDVIIVGAGLAGLYAARKLSDEGWNVTIVEATQRYGGRVKPLEDFADFTIETGGEYLTGGGPSQGNGTSCGHKCHLYSDLQALDSKILTSVWADTAKMDEVYDMNSGLEWGWETKDKGIARVWKWYKDFPKFLDQDLTVAEFIDRMYGVDRNHRTYHIYEAYMGVEYGTSISRLGQYDTATDWGMWEDSGLWGLWRNNVLDALTELYFRPILDRIVYNSPILNIDYSGERVVATDFNGVRYEADAILVTVSLGVLKSNMIEFTPNLPSDKIQAINTIGMDHCMKIILRFKKRFWEKRMMGLIQNGTTNTCWAQGLVRQNATNNVLVCLVTGENAEYMHSLGEQGMIERALHDLDSMFGCKTASRVFDDAYVQDWGADPFVRGCYSYPAPGTYPVGGTPMGEVLAQPVNDRLFFGGEATSRFHKATLHGALEGGARAARQIDSVLSK